MKPSPLIKYNSTQRFEYQKLSEPDNLGGYFLEKSKKLLESTCPPPLGAAVFNGTRKYSQVLEVGSGFGSHLQYLSFDFDCYYMTDFGDINFDACKSKYPLLIKQGKLILESQDAQKLKYEDNKFDRLIASQVLEHLSDPVSVLFEWNRVVKNNGIISIALPSDPGLLWRLGRHFGPRRNAIKQGFEYDYQQAYEHVNSIFNLVTFIKYHFEDIEEKWYPSLLPFPDINLFYICHIRVKK